MPKRSETQSLEAAVKALVSAADSLREINEVFRV